MSGIIFEPKSENLEMSSEADWNTDSEEVDQNKLQKIDSIWTSSYLTNSDVEIIRKKLKALKNLQLQSIQIEAKFFEEIYELEKKYHNLFVPQYEKRNAIINGKYEPTEEECTLKLEDEIFNVDGVGDVEVENENIKGIPLFWLTCLKKVSLVRSMIEPYDVPILEHLEDIKTVYKDDSMGFILEFYFSTNDYFSNFLLTKEYFMKSCVDEEDPFSFEGLEIYKCKGCHIDWHEGKNVTEQMLEKKQTQKGTGEVRTIVRQTHCDSFFNFFNPPVTSENADEVDEGTRLMMTLDFEIGHYIRKRIIPEAVLFFTGEAIYESSEDSDSDEEEESSGTDEGGEDTPEGKEQENDSTLIVTEECKTDPKEEEGSTPSETNDQ